MSKSVQNLIELAAQLPEEQFEQFFREAAGMWRRMSIRALTGLSPGDPVIVPDRTGDVEGVVDEVFARGFRMTDIEGCSVHVSAGSPFHRKQIKGKQRVLVHAAQGDYEGVLESQRGELATVSIQVGDDPSAPRVVRMVLASNLEVL